MIRSRGIVLILSFISLMGLFVVRGYATARFTQRSDWSTQFGDSGCSPAPADYDGDGAVDMSVKCENGRWYIRWNSSGTSTYFYYGTNSNDVASADYDGDRKADIALRANGGIFYLDYASDGFGNWATSFPGYSAYSACRFVPGDYDGDSKADIAMRCGDGNWYIDYSANGLGAFDKGFHMNACSPAPGDYDGDGKTDAAVLCETGILYIDYSANGFGTQDESKPGYPNCVPVPHDYDGDGKTDFAVYCGGNWQIDYSSNGLNGIDRQYPGFGNAYCTPLPADYNGNGGDDQVDRSVYCPDGDNRYWFFNYAPPGDVYEPDNRRSKLKQEIIAGTPQNNRSIDPEFDQDWVKFTLNELSGVVLQTSGPSGDTVMWLYNQTLVQQAYDDDGGEGAFSRIERTCASSPLPAGTYYVKVAAYEYANTIPSYNLTYQVTPCGQGGNTAADTVGLYNPAAGVFYLKNTHNGGAADITLRFGPANVGWTPLAGDWDGNGTDTVGLFNPATSIFYLKNSNVPGVADVVFRFGPANAGWTPIAGDWNGNGITTVGLYNPTASTFYLKNSYGGGAADVVFRFGPANAGWTPLVGNWDGQ